LSQDKNLSFLTGALAVSGNVVAFKTGKIQLRRIHFMAIDLLRTPGTPLDQQRFNWRELIQVPFSKLNDDAFTRVRIILMNGIEAETVRFQHAAARFSDNETRVALAKIRRVDHFQNIMINWLNPADQSPLETTLGYEQTAIEITADVALKEPDAYLAQAYRFGMLEDFDHLYRFSALYDRVFGKDANALLQNYTDIRPGRPTSLEHRAPEDDVRIHYNRMTASPVSKLNALTIVSAEHQVRDFYSNIGPLFADPVVRELYAEIVTIEEQHVTHYESLQDPNETILEKWLLHEANEVYNYWSCVEQETNPRIKAIWERFLNYELGQLQFVMELFKKKEKRDPAEILPSRLPDPISYSSHRKFVRETLNNEIPMSAKGHQFVPRDQESETTRSYRKYVNSSGSPSENVAAGYQWKPGTEQTTQPVKETTL
jgi:hypothetical protein